MKKTIEFLCGAQPNEKGLWFHEEALKHKGSFWWRVPMRKAFYDKNDSILEVAGCLEVALRELAQVETSLYTRNAERLIASSLRYLEEMTHDQ